LKPVVAVLDDLFFTVKIADAAKRAGLTITFIKDADQALARVQEQACIVVVDLNRTSQDPIDLIGRIKQSVPDTPVIGFVSHVQVETRQRAQQAGCDVVLARSIVSTQLPELLQKFAA
jgi:CheY-like chemotaxis protein